MIETGMQLGFRFSTVNSIVVWYRERGIPIQVVDSCHYIQNAELLRFIDTTVG